MKVTLKLAEDPELPRIEDLEKYDVSFALENQKLEPCGATYLKKGYEFDFETLGFKDTLRISYYKWDESPEDCVYSFEIQLQFFYGKKDFPITASDNDGKLQFLITIEDPSSPSTHEDGEDSMLEETRVESGKRTIDDRLREKGVYDEVNEASEKAAKKAYARLLSKYKVLVKNHQDVKNSKM